MIRQFKPVKGGVLPTKYGAFDCETEGLYGQAKLICLVIPNQPDRVFKGDNCVDEFIAEVTRPKYRGFHLYAHNLSFDLEKTFGKEGNTLDNKKFTLIAAGTRLIKAIYHFEGNKTLTLLDTLNLVPATSLAEIGNDMGYKKLKTPEKWLSGDPVTEITDEDIEYCIRDCKIVLKILDVYAEMLKPFKIKLKGTVGANAKAVWKAIELKDSGMFLNEEKDERFRESYYGGRTEVFIRAFQKKRLYYYDINSMYPAAMMFNKFPNPDKLSYSKDLTKALKDDEGCAKLTVRIPDMAYPPLPYRSKKLIFPIGVITGTWNFPEIRLALDKGCEILEIHWVLSSPPLNSPFKQYVEYFMGLKIKFHKEGKKALRNLAKRMLNSLYGKFAQRIDVEDRYTHEEPPMGVPYKKMGDNTYKLKNVDKERAMETVVCWSSYITSYARVMLYNFFPTSKGLYYCDTDSIVTDHELASELVHDTEFGLMSVEDIIDESYFVAPKRYAYKNDKGKVIRKIKGVYKDVVKNIPLESFGQSIGVFYHKPYKTKTALSRGVKAYSKETVRKSLKTTDDKRLFDAGGESVPIKIVLIDG